MRKSRIRHVWHRVCTVANLMPKTLARNLRSNPVVSLMIPRTYVRFRRAGKCIVIKGGFYIFSIILSNYTKNAGWSKHHTNLSLKCTTLTIQVADVSSKYLTRNVYPITINTGTFLLLNKKRKNEHERKQHIESNSIWNRCVEGLRISAT